MALVPSAEARNAPFTPACGVPASEPAPLYPPRVVPPPQRLPLWRFVPAFVRNPLSTLPQAVYEQPIVRFEDSISPTIYVTGPELVKSILLDDRDKYARTPIEKRVLGAPLGNGILTANGADWRWQRQIAAPLFRHQDLLALVPAISATAEAQAATWRKLASGAVVQIEPDMTKLTFDVISATLLPGGQTHLSDKIERANQHFLGPISWALVYAIFGLPHWFPHPGKGRMAAAAQTLRQSVAAIIAERRASLTAANPKPDDIMQRLMDAKHPETGQAMSDEQLIDNLLTFFSAGHETTAKALTWTLYLLARAPAWQARLADEVMRVVGDGPVEASHIDQLVSTTQVIKESMRLYPPAPIISRVTVETAELGGAPVAPGVTMVIPIYAIHRHKALWQDPDRFDPDRFATEREKHIARYQYMPFGAGPRICIGMAFAMIEAVAILATLVRAVRVETAGPYEPVPVSRITLRPSRGMPLRVLAR